MSTGRPGDGGAPAPFSEEEVAAATQGPAGDPELEDVDAASIDAVDGEAPFERLQARARRLTPQQLRNVVESVLFVAPAPLAVEQLVEVVGVDRGRVEQALAELAGARREGLSGVVLHEVAGGWQFRTAPESSDWVKRYLKVKPQRLTRAALETLAIVAYRQPVTRPEVEDIRGVDSGAVLKALLERRLVRMVGKKEEVGRPILYGTTREFLEFFGLKDLASLPTLRELHELTEEHRQLVEKVAPPAAVGTVDALADPAFHQRLAAADQASEAALGELEQAIDSAEATTKAARKVLEPEAPPAPDAAQSEG